MTVQTDDRLINIDILGALRRRKWYGIAVAVIGIGITYAIVKNLPSVYRSVSTILIEEPDVPPDLVKSTVSTYANDRLQIIQQRVMTSQHLNEVIDRFGLYPELQQVMPRSSIIQQMRSKVQLSVVSANLGGSQGKSRQQGGQATIAFTLSFDHPNPTIAQQVANRLTDLYLAENNRSRQERAAGTTLFLTEQAEKLSSDVATLDQRLLDLKSKYSGSLPEQFNFNTQMLSQAQAQLMQNRSDLQILNDRRSYLQMQLSQVSPHTAVTAEGRPMTPQSQLMALELQHNELSAKYGAKHPDVIKLDRQIESLRQRLGGVDSASLDRLKFDALQSELNDALQRYGEQHPDVQRLRRQLQDLSAAASAAPKLAAPQSPPDNPFYLQLQGQLAEVTAQITAIGTRNAAIEANIQQLQERILQTPAIETEYNSLKEQHAAALQRYQSFKDKEADAQVAETMEMQSKGETFSVIEAPLYPDIPISPNRKLLYAAGALLSLMLASALMLGLDLLDSRIYDAKALVSVFGEAPLATVPYIQTRAEQRSRRLRVAGVTSLVIVAVLVIGSVMVLKFMPVS